MKPRQNKAGWTTEVTLHEATVPFHENEEFIARCEFDFVVKFPQHPNSEDPVYKSVVADYALLITNCWPFSRELMTWKINLMKNITKRQQKHKDTLAFKIQYKRRILICEMFPCVLL